MVFLWRCEDPAPFDYYPINVVEAILVVNKPIKEIRITRTLPLNVEYDYGNAVYKDAVCYIYEGENKMELVLNKALLSTEL